MMQLGCDGNFVGSGIFKSKDPARRAKAIVEATTHFNDPDVIARVSEGIGEPMRGLDIRKLPEGELLQTRGVQGPRGGLPAAEGRGGGARAGAMKIGVLA